MFTGAAFAHANTLASPLLAIDTVPEPTSVMVGAGLLLVGLGFARKRLSNK